MVVKNVMSLRQLREKYDISKGRVYKATMNREFKYFRLGGSQVGKIYVNEEDFIEWLTKLEVPSRQEIESLSAIPV